MSETPLEIYLNDNSMSRVEFAKRAKLAYVDVSRVATGARKASVRVAKIIDEVTSGQVSKHDLRPDIFEKEAA